MPLPAGGPVPWPPTQLSPILTEIDRWDAWYSGDPDRLAATYGAGSATASAQGGFEPARSGIVGRMRRWFWGQPTPTGEQTAKLHVPVAADLATTSADLLFAEPPDISADDKAARDRLDAIRADGTFDASLIEAADVAAGLGGVFLRIVWDQAVADRPLITAVHPDGAVPDFRLGRLVAVTFWHEVKRDGQDVWRHLERHEPGVILHGLYRGTPDELGRRVPVTDVEQTAWLADVLDDGDAVRAIPGRLTSVYVPNMRPAREWRTHPLGCHLGRSDFAGPLMGLMDALDETYTAWMRDVRVGKARLIVPQSYLEVADGRGKGARLDLDRTVFVGLNTLGGGRDGAMQIEAQQFVIRWAEHQNTAADLVTQIVRGAGYSMQTWGETGDVAATATEVTARQQRSMTTRGKKILYWRAALSDLLTTLLAVDALVFGTGMPQVPVLAEWPDGVQDGPKTLAETAGLLRTAEAASTDTLVRMVHPDWDDDAVAAEVQRITDERAVAVPDPATFGNNGDGLDPAADPNQ